MPRHDMPREARDTGNQGINFLALLHEVKLVHDEEEIKASIRKGRLSLNNTIIKDIKYHIEPGTYSINLDNKPLMEVTLL